jgi:hypothetical protein
MDGADIDLLREAVRVRQRKEPLERAIGRAVRNRNLDYSYYIALMSELREAASRDKVSAEEEIRILTEEDKDQD